MGVTWQILYRGPLSSCNYDCGYCPFAKRTNTRAELDDDRVRLERFTAWVAAQVHVRVGVLFTPWGEALIHPHYQRAMVALSHQTQVHRVAIQTNLSGSLAWLTEARRETLGIWATWHPSEIPLDRFLARCQELDRQQVRYSVGVVGRREHADDVEQLRAALRPDVYLWVNAFKDVRDYYDERTISRLAAVDPLFRVNLANHSSLGHACAAGETSFTVDGEGTAFRCHFVKQPIGNIYAPEFAAALQPRPCPQAVCTCHIGYVHLKRLQLGALFGDGILERIPEPRTLQRWIASGRSAMFTPTVRKQPVAS